MATIFVQVSVYEAYWPIWIAIGPCVSGDVTRVCLMKYAHCFIVICLKIKINIALSFPYGNVQSIVDNYSNV